MSDLFFKYKKPGYFLLIYLSCSLFLWFGSSSEAQALESESEAVEEATNPAQQVTDEIPTDAQSVAHGRQLFGQHCNVCHMVERQLIGPALASVHNRRPVPWLMAFIRNSQAIISSGEDEYAEHLFSQYNEVLMPSFEFLSDDDIYSILSYIKAESVSPTTAGGVNGTDQETVTRPQEEYGSEEDPAYSQKEGDAMEVREQVSGSLERYILFAISLLVVVGVLYYVVRLLKKTKTKENA